MTRYARWLLSAALCCCACVALAQKTSALPASVTAALARAQIGAEALGVVVAPVGNPQAPRLNHQSQQAFNPASVMKLVTTAAALDLLGPSHTWHTPVLLDGVVKDGVLQGDLVIQGQGDPKLVLERLWLLLRRVQGLGVHTIAGDIVLDHSAFAVPDSDPGEFDGEPLKPYNASPDALLLNFKALVMTFAPAREGGVARVQYDPPLAGVQLPPTVPLTKGNAECGDWRASLRADFSDPLRVRFAGAYPASCGERVWPVAYADPAHYAERAVHGLWLAMGGKLTGSARRGQRPAQSPATFEASSEPLALLVRDINKYSNNVMAQQLFLTLGRTNTTNTANTDGAVARQERSQQVLAQWWQAQLPGVAAPVLENGSGLSRKERISAAALGALLERAWSAPWMPEYLASLPVVGVDGTLKRMKTLEPVNAHLKTGTLRDASALAGYVLGRSGQRYVLVALVNHPNAPAARAALQALVEWTAQDQ